MKNIDESYEIIAPLANSLINQKVIIKDVTTVIARIEKILITPERFEAIAVKILTVSNSPIAINLHFPKKWKFGAIWDIILYENKCLHAINVNWTMWFDHNLVQEVERLTQEGKNIEALALLRIL